MNDSDPRYPEPIEALIVVLSAFSLIILTGLIYSLIHSGGTDLEQSDKTVQIFFNVSAVRGRIEKKAAGMIPCGITDRYQTFGKNGDLVAQDVAPDSAG